MTPLLFAYLDPGNGSLILQALIGGFSGLAVLGRYLWIQFTGRNPIQAVARPTTELPHVAR